MLDWDVSDGPGAYIKDLSRYFTESIRVLEAALGAWTEDLIHGALAAITTALHAGKPVLVCGNGGSAADAMHLTGELVARFLADRRALNVICLSSNASVLTACANDDGFETIFSRQVEAYGQPGSVLLGISTSGRSRNVLAAFEQARARGMCTIALTGEGGGLLAPLSDYLFAVPSRSTPLIQQAHLCLYHYLCQQIEQQFVPAPASPQVHLQAL
jgi:D-sedoheptulose 7-phosphate isomerase